jgi:sensor c-di-GMP phosphodiesterase-like protein
MTEMARLLKKPVVAEFVETEAVADMLHELGVDWAQGFHYHRPEPLTADALLACLAPQPAPPSTGGAEVDASCGADSDSASATPPAALA